MTLSFFTFTWQNAHYFYYLCEVNGNYTSAMALMDKAHVINLPERITGALWGSVVTIIVFIILDK
jgi:hypothetical protein